MAFLATEDLSSKDIIKKDLTEQRPMYRLSSYGPAKNEPCLISGQDTSQDELRWMYYKVKGDVSQYVSRVGLVSVEILTRRSAGSETRARR
jgi:hypothetical protein